MLGRSSWGGRPEFQPGFEDGDTSVQGAVPFYGVYDVVQPGPRSILMGALHFMRRMVMKKSFREETEAFAKASPVHPAGGRAAVPGHPRHPRLARPGRAGPRIRAASARGLRGTGPVRRDARRQHGFDVFPSYRTARVIEGVERYLTGLHRQYREKRRGQARPTARPGVPEEITEALE